MAYFPIICVDCHVQMKSTYIGPTEKNKYHPQSWVRVCPLCDGTKGFVDMGYVLYKELNKEDIPFYRFMKGKSPHPDK